MNNYILIHVMQTRGYTYNLKSITLINPICQLLSPAEVEVYNKCNICLYCTYGCVQGTRMHT